MSHILDRLTPKQIAEGNERLMNAIFPYCRGCGKRTDNPKKTPWGQATFCPVCWKQYRARKR